MKLITLTQGKFAVVDDEDFEHLNQFKWHYAYDKLKGKSGYAKRRGPKINGRLTWIWMHKYIISVGEGDQVDHVDGCRLNNQKNNLRKCTSQQNNFNQKLSRRNTSGFKGVQWNKHAGKFVSRLRINRVDVHLGMFENPIEAAVAYDQAAVIHFGEFAKTNREMGLIL